MSDRILIHVGEGDDRKTYDFSPSKLLNVEWIAIEEITGLTKSEVLTKAGNLSLTAITALVWILRRRTEPGLAFGAVVFGGVELEDPDLVEDTEVPKEDGEPEAVPPALS